MKNKHDSKKTVPTATETKKRFPWWIIAVSVVAVAAIAVGAIFLLQPADKPKTSYQEVAETFVEAYYLRDRNTQFSLTFYNARQQWIDTAIADNGSEEAFFAEAQKQADDRGIDAKVTGFDSYFDAYHQFYLTDAKNVYGEYTVTVQMTDSKKLDDALLNDYREKQLDAIDPKYIDADAFNAVTEAYLLTVNLHVAGEKKDLNENYLVYVVYHNDQWLVVSHSA